MIELKMTNDVREKFDTADSHWREAKFLTSSTQQIFFVKVIHIIFNIDN